MRTLDILTGFTMCSFIVFGLPTSFNTQDSTKLPYPYQNIESEFDEISRFTQNHRHKQFYYMSAIIAKDLKNSLNELIEKLRKFVAKGNYDLKAFEHSADVIQKELSEIAYWIANLPYLDEEILYQFSFAEDMLEAMTSSVITLNYYCSNCKDGQGLVSDIIKLNVKLFRFFDINGTPNPKLKDYAKRILQYGLMLKLLKNTYDLLHEKSLEVGPGFEIEYYSALETLRVLACYIPKEDHAYKPGLNFFPASEYNLN